MKKNDAGFTFIELFAVLILVGILLSIIVIKFRGYETQFRCQSAAKILAMDIKLQQQRSTTMDEQQGIYFMNNGKYSLGKSRNPISSNNGTTSLPYSDFISNKPPKEVTLPNGITINSIYNIDNNPAFNLTPPVYIFFDPKTSDVSGNWVPRSGFKGRIKLGGSRQPVILEVKPDSINIQ